MLESANPKELLAMYQGPSTNNPHPPTKETPRDIPDITRQVIAEEPGDTASQKLIWYSIWDIHD